MRKRKGRMRQKTYAHTEENLVAPLPSFPPSLLSSLPARTLGQ
jgi:hypothetical protein